MMPRGQDGKQVPRAPRTTGRAKATGRTSPYLRFHSPPIRGDFALTAHFWPLDLTGLKDLTDQTLTRLPPPSSCAAQEARPRAVCGSVCARQAVRPGAPRPRRAPHLQAPQTPV